MLPYYEHDGVAIYHGDSRRVLPAIAARPDIVLTDPPYGIGYKPMRESELIANDTDPEIRAVAEVFASIGAVPAVYAFCDWRSLPAMHSALARSGNPPKACIVWDKGHGVQNLDRFAKAHELLLYAGPYGGQRTRGTDVWRCQRDYDPDHPTPKPVSLLIRALDYAEAQPGQLVLDPFMGSGSTLRAAKDLGCRAIGIEVEERYCEIAARRLAQGVLDFGGVA